MVTSMAKISSKHTFILPEEKIENLSNIFQIEASLNIYSSLFISWGTDKENFFSNQDLLQFGIVTFILLTMMCEGEGILKGEIRCWSLLFINSDYNCNDANHNGNNNSADILLRSTFERILFVLLLSFSQGLGAILDWVTTRFDFMRGL